MFVCVCLVCWFIGVFFLVKNFGVIDMVIFWENIEDIYVGIEYFNGIFEVDKVKKFFMEEMGVI